MVYKILFSNEYQKQCDLIKKLLNEKLDNNRVCVIEESAEKNEFNMPKIINIVFKINNLEFKRISYRVYGHVGNHIHYDSSDMKFDTYISNIMHHIPGCYNYNY